MTSGGALKSRRTLHSFVIDTRGWLEKRIHNHSISGSEGVSDVSKPAKVPLNYENWFPFILLETFSCNEGAQTLFCHSHCNNLHFHSVFLARFQINIGRKTFSSFNHLFSMLSVPCILPVGFLLHLMPTLCHLTAASTLHTGTNRWI